MKTFILVVLVALLLGGIVGTSVDVFDLRNNSKYVSVSQYEYLSNAEKMSMRQIDSLSAASNLSFTRKNAIR
ncbi:MAG: hypothetical protein R6W68_15895 [Ignavibacteriaceae bacterium]